METKTLNKEGLKKLITKILKENWSSDYFSDEDEFLKSFKYFVDTYINGNFSQLKELRIYLDGLQSKYATEIKNWIIDNV